MLFKKKKNLLGTYVKYSHDTVKINPNMIIREYNNLISECRRKIKIYKKEQEKFEFRFNIDFPEIQTEKIKIIEYETCCSNLRNTCLNCFNHHHCSKHMYDYIIKHEIKISPKSKINKLLLNIKPDDLDLQLKKYKEYNIKIKEIENDITTIMIEKDIFCKDYKKYIKMSR